MSANFQVPVRGLIGHHCTDDFLDSKGLRIDVDYISIRRKNIGMMSNRRLSKGIQTSKSVALISEELVKQTLHMRKWEKA